MVDHRIPTERRRFADDSPRAFPYSCAMITNQRQQPMPPFSAMTEELWPARLGPFFPNRDTSFVTGTDESSAAADDRARHPTRATGATRRDIAAKLAASLAFALVGCATPVLKPSVDVPDRFAATQASIKSRRPPGGTATTIRCSRVSSAEPRPRTGTSRSRRSACVRREPARRSAARGCSRASAFTAPASITRTGYDSAIKQTVPEAANTKGWQGGVDVSWEIDIAGRLRAGAAAAAADTLAAEHTARGVRLLVMTDVATNYFMLVGALRQLDTVRAISAAQDETLRLVTARQRAGLATPFDVERAQTDASRARARDPAARDAGRRIASSHRGAHRRPGVQCRAASTPSRGDIDRPAGACRPTGRICCSAGPTCSPRRRSSTPPMRVASRRWPNGSRGCSSAPCSAARA